MTETLYFRDAAAAASPTAGTKSLVLVDGSISGPSSEDRSLSRTAGSVLAAVSTDCNGGTPERDYLGRFSSPALLAQTIPAQTWTVGFESLEEDPGQNMFLAVSLYVWNPGGSSVRGRIYDSTAQLGSEWSDTTTPGQVVTFAGSSVAASANDILVLEVWAVSTADTSGGGFFSYFNYNGATTIQAGVASGDAKSYLSCPSPLYLTGDALLQPAAATATAAGNTPAISAAIAPGVSTASASANAPALSASLAPPAAAAAVAANVPVVSVSLAPPAATASAAAFVPVPGITITPDLAAAIAAAIVPDSAGEVLAVTVAEPLLKWHVHDPSDKWETAEPREKWTGQQPSDKWRTTDPGGKWHLESLSSVSP